MRHRNKTQMWRRDLRTQKGKGRVGQIARVGLSVYIYTQRERERESERECVCVWTYIHIRTSLVA